MHKSVGCFSFFLMKHKQLLNWFQLDEQSTPPPPLFWLFPSRSSSVSSRSSLAHLYSAGFPPIVDSNGQVAEVLDPTEPVPFDPQFEETDFLQDNLLVFQFLAFTRWGLSYWVTRRTRRFFSIMLKSGVFAVGALAAHTTRHWDSRC